MPNRNGDDTTFGSGSRGVVEILFAAQAAADLANRLPQSMLILDQGQAEEALARLAEAATGADGDLRLLQQLQSKIDRTVQSPLEGADLAPTPTYDCRSE